MSAGPSGDASPRTPRVALVGGLGRLGREIVACARADGRVAITVIVHRRAADPFGGVPVVAEIPARDVDVVVDVSTPEAVLDTVSVAADAGRGLVIGVTGLSGEADSWIHDASRRIPIVLAPNLSRGATALMALARAATRFCPDADVEIVEMHHRHKRDAPSGTAHAIVRAIRDERADLVARVGRDAAAGARAADEIGVHAVRGGDVVGEHTVVFAGDGERIELTHRAGNRSAFARGAIDAARFVIDRAPGLFTMADVLDAGT